MRAVCRSHCVRDWGCPALHPRPGSMHSALSVDETPIRPSSPCPALLWPGLVRLTPQLAPLSHPALQPGPQSRNPGSLSATWRTPCSLQSSDTAALVPRYWYRVSDKTFSSLFLLPQLWHFPSWKLSSDTSPEGFSRHFIELVSLWDSLDGCGCFEQSILQWRKWRHVFWLKLDCTYGQASLFFFHICYVFLIFLEKAFLERTNSEKHRCFKLR